MNSPTNLVAVSHEFLLPALSPGTRAIDATCGNGHDTLFLAVQVGASGTVHAIDLQAAAVEATRRRLSEAGLDDRVTFILGNHAHALSQLAARHAHGVAAILFNLGYHPGGDPAVITSPATTLPALSAALDLLAPSGRLVVVAYPGHPGGALEAEAIEGWFSALDPAEFDAAGYHLLNQDATTPRLFAAIRREGR